MANILSMLLGGLAGKDAPTDVAGVDVVAKLPQSAVVAAPPPMVARNPFTADYIQAAQQASQVQAQLPRVSGGTDAGLFGFLPQRFQQGRLRDIIGAIGDGLLIEGGHKPIYAPRKEARQMGQALIGYDQDPEQALLRLAQTGTPDAVEMAQKGIQNLETREQKAIQQEQLNNYRQQQMDLKRFQSAQQLTPYLRSIMADVKDADGYSKAWDRMSQMLSRMGIKADATEVFGIPGPNDYEEGMLENLGLKAADILRGQTTREGIGQRATAASQASADRRAAIGQRATAASQASADRRYAVDNKPKTGTGAKPTPKAGAKPAAKLTPASAGPKKPDAAMIKAYQGGTPAQRAQARAAWRAQGYDVRNLK